METGGEGAREDSERGSACSGVGEGQCRSQKDQEPKNAFIWLRERERDPVQPHNGSLSVHHASDGCNWTVGC